MVAVHVVVFHAHDRLRHLLRRVRWTGRRLEMVVCWVERVHLLSLGGCLVLHHVGTPLEMLCQVLLQLDIGV